MGVDFLERTAPKFWKAVSRDAEAVARMTRGVSTSSHRRVVVADCAAGADVSAGLSLIVRTDGKELVLIDGLYEVGRVYSPPFDVLRSIEEMGGFTEGVVEYVNTLGGTFDVDLP
jgi:hypothetical protein